MQSDDNDSAPTEQGSSTPPAPPSATASPRPKRVVHRKRGTKLQPKPIEGCGTAFLTPNQTCELLGVTRAMLLKIEERGILKPVRFGHTVVRFRLSDIERMASE